MMSEMSARPIQPEVTEQFKVHQSERSVNPGPVLTLMEWYESQPRTVAISLRYA
jgi:hypothetical protein